LKDVRVYLIRHADAVSEDVAGLDDDRWLSPRGREAARVLARLLREERVELDAIVSSPLARAVQTAELVANGLDYIGQIECLRALAPGAHPRPAAAALATRGMSIAVVGHEPGLSMLGALLIGLPSFPSFRTAQACAIVDGAPTFTARADLGAVRAMFGE
jgi:phosphohistidine phosphatase